MIFYALAILIGIFYLAMAIDVGVSLWRHRK